MWGSLGQGGIQGGWGYKFVELPLTLSPPPPAPPLRSILCVMLQCCSCLSSSSLWPHLGDFQLPRCWWNYNSQPLPSRPPLPPSLPGPRSRSLHTLTCNLLLFSLQKGELYYAVLTDAEEPHSPQRRGNADPGRGKSQPLLLLILLLVIIKRDSSAENFYVRFE